MNIQFLTLSDIDECGLSPAVCNSFSTCSDTVGNYTCACDEGYESENGFEDDCTGSTSGWPRNLMINDTS